jgi:hypothetical protein
VVETATLQGGADEFEDPKNLKLDLRNPRSPDGAFDTEEDVIDYLVDHADVDELIQAILSSGWHDYEALIVLDDENIVLEGNRRLAALRILADPDLQAHLRIELDEEVGPAALPDAVRIRRVPSRRDARDYIGFKHINGPFKWDSLSKAKYAAEWSEDGGDIQQISRRLGDRHNTVVRLVNGWNVLKQSLAHGFDLKEKTKKSFLFSHLYTGLSRPNVRRYLGLPTDDASAVLPSNPVPEKHLDNLQAFMSWLYGQGREKSVIQSQNPDLNRLVEVLGNESARIMLEASRDLDAAYDLVEDKGLKFSEALMNTIRQAEDALRLVGNYDGRADLMGAADNLRRTVLSLHFVVRSNVWKARPRKGTK